MCLPPLPNKFKKKNTAGIRVRVDERGCVGCGAVTEMDSIHFFFIRTHFKKLNFIFVSKLRTFKEQPQVENKKNCKEILENENLCLSQTDHIFSEVLFFTYNNCFLNLQFTKILFF